MLAVFGPTAVGKSALVHAAARVLGAEVIVADPFQRYRGLEIASDAPSAKDMAEVPYHAVGDVDLADESTAGTFAQLAHGHIDRIVKSGGIPIVAGGTGLYVRAALAEMHMRPAPPADVRAWAEDVASRPAEAAEMLRRRAPDVAATIDLANARRVARALERIAMGEDADGGGDIWTEPFLRPALVVGVTRPRDQIHRRIAARVRRELDDGLVAELDAARARPDLARAPTQIIGMREVQAMRAGQMHADALEEALNLRTRKLARIQDTWMRKMTPDAMIDLGADAAHSGVDQLVAIWRRARGDVG